MSATIFSLSFGGCQLFSKRPRKCSQNQGFQFADFDLSVLQFYIDPRRSCASATHFVCHHRIVVRAKPIVALVRAVNQTNLSSRGADMASARRFSLRASARAQGRVPSAAAADPARSAPARARAPRLLEPLSALLLLLRLCVCVAKKGRSSSEGVVHRKGLRRP